jgi:nucleoid-associated protein EbfC
MLDKMKQLYEMQKKAKEMQKALDELKIERVSPGGKVSLTLNGSFKVESLSIDPEALKPENKSALEKTLVDLFSEAAAEVKQKSAQQAMGMMKEMNLKIPGM